MAAGGERMVLANAADLPDALAAALDNGAPVAPLAADPTERGRALTMLRPEALVLEADAAAVVATSGSTGTPKGVVLSRGAIRSAVAATHSRLGGPGHWVLVLPSHYVAGLMVLARAQIAGTTVRVGRSDLADLPDHVRDLADLPDQARDPADHRRYLAVVPTQLARACRSPRTSTALATFDAVLVGGAAVEPDLLHRARRLGIPVVTTYGMSETCGGCVYDGKPLDGVAVSAPASGPVTITSPAAFSGYRLRPDLTASVLHGQTVITADRGRWRDGRLEVLGRTDDVVISGGHNVDLAELERRVRAWPALRGAEAAVLGLADPEWGIRVVAVVEGPTPDPRDPPLGPSLTREALQAHLRPLLPAYALPRDLLTHPRLPRTSSGKIDRPALRRDVAATLTAANPPVVTAGQHR